MKTRNNWIRMWLSRNWNINRILSDNKRERIFLTWSFWIRVHLSQLRRRKDKNLSNLRLVVRRWGISRLVLTSDRGPGTREKLSNSKSWRRSGRRESKRRLKRVRRLRRSKVRVRKVRPKTQIIRRVRRIRRKNRLRSNK